MRALEKGQSGGEKVTSQEVSRALSPQSCNISRHMVQTQLSNVNQRHWGVAEVVWEHGSLHLCRVNI